MARLMRLGIMVFVLEEFLSRSVDYHTYREDGYHFQYAVEHIELKDFPFPACVHSASSISTPACRDWIKVCRLP
jgi:hypothetical protein